MLSYCILISFLVLLVHSLGDDRPVVQTSLGTISGHYKTSHDGRTFSAYEGIPYAKPPIGDLRFQAPQQLEPWIGTWNAIAVQTCIQPNWKAPEGEMMGNEDCLYLNVYVPKEKINENLDVVVFIHGGAFIAGSTKLGGPELIMDRDIVYVTINYRLGILGFIYTEDDSVSGNNGLKDQILALKWIQTHIKDFGGNPNSVTIIGGSAGAASVHLHYFSPSAKGLFHRGISNSGTALAPYTIKEAPLSIAEKLAKLVGCPTASTKELVKCLKQRPAQDIVKYSDSYSSFPKLPITSFAPVVEKEGEGAYLTDYPYNLLVKGEMHDIPWMCSATSGEGSLALIALDFQLPTLANAWNSVLPLLLEYDKTVDVKYQDEVSAKIKEFYYGNEVPSADNIQKLIKMYGDRLFYLSMEQATRLQAKVIISPVYSYLFGYIGKYKNPALVSFGIKDSYGVGHGDDGQYCYYVSFRGISVRNETLNRNEDRIKDLLLDIITSFAKTGKPVVKNVNWEPINSDSEDYQYLSVNNDDIKIVATKELAPTQFWHSLPIQENENLGRLTDERL